MKPGEFEQLSLDDALTQREVAIARAADGATTDWHGAAHEAVTWCARNRPTFTTDDVLLRMEAMGAPRTHNLSALGPVMLSAAREGRIVKTGDMRPSRLAQRHRDLTVWRRRPR